MKLRKIQVLTVSSGANNRYDVDWDLNGVDERLVEC